ncbi:MAG: 1,4-dihydroxy-2-naphthoate octaprenyltransferase [Bacteroidia bacterium]|nr:1,4-dihydroxy-2-naphthoate octaprenyltransferase [Bacteroidia bacterium]
MNLTNWISAFRLRTLFLSLSCISGGLFCAHLEGEVDTGIAFLTLLTALFLQILSNLANDYGDSIHGADHSGRKGPQRTVQSGKISKENMKKGIVAFSLLSLISGIVLLYFASRIIGRTGSVILLLCGLLSIVAAVAYTNGKKPYGYMGLGDIAVFIFFGITGVTGSYYLQTGQLNHFIYLFPALAYGFLSTGVLNINNMRDIESDQTAGKNSIPVRLGLPKAKIYHYALLAGAVICFTFFIMQSQLHLLLLLPVFGLLFLNALAVFRAKNASSFDPLLKYLSLSTFFLTLLFYLSL